jgi:cytochrome P450
VIWASANRDETVFDAPDEFRLDRDPAQNLLYGAGVHVCPGAGLSRLQLRIVMEHVLAMTRDIALAPHAQAERACYPASGFVVLPLQVRR